MLGEEHFYFFGLRVMAEICDAYGECVDSNEILVQAMPMVSDDVGGQLMETVAGNSSKLLTATSTKNAKIVSAIAGAVASYLKTNITDPNVIEATRASLLSTTARPVNRLVYSDKSDSPHPTAAHLDEKSDMNFFDISQISNADSDDDYDGETAETEGISHSVEEQEKSEDQAKG